MADAFYTEEIDNQIKRKSDQNQSITSTLFIQAGLNSFSELSSANLYLEESNSALVEKINSRLLPDHYFVNSDYISNSASGMILNQLLLSQALSSCCSETAQSSIFNYDDTFSIDNIKKLNYSNCLSKILPSYELTGTVNQFSNLVNIAFNKCTFTLDDPSALPEITVTASAPAVEYRYIKGEDKLFRTLLGNTDRTISFYLF